MGSFPSGETIGQAFSAVAQDNPETIAVRDVAMEATYGLLDAWSNRIAHEIERITGPETGVLLMASEFDCCGVAGLIAASKTRHALLTVDTNVPLPVLQDIAYSQSPTICLANRSARDIAKELASKTGIRILDISKFRTGPPTEAPQVAGSADDLSALRRTSGSTGKGKLVAVTHAGEISRARNGARLNLVEPGSLYSAATSLEVGMGRGATLRALLAGATLLPLDLRRETPRDAVARLVRTGVTHFHGTPTGLRLLASGLGQGELLERLTFIHLGGEQSTSRDLSLVREIAPGACILKVVYSSSETGVVGLATFRAEEIDPSGNIAFDIAPSVRVNIQGPDGSPIEQGKTGRISVIGSGLSSGYHNSQDPDLLSRHQVRPDGTVAFLTDDLGRIAVTGQLFLEGRVGNEVKIRGQRVDLRQLENWLLNQDGITQAVAFPVESAEGTQVAAAVSGSPSNLRQAMMDEIPIAMHPSHLLELNELPKTASMKIDRQALIRLVDEMARDDSPVMGELDDLAGAVAWAWQEATGRMPSTRAQTFGELGGDSVQAMSLVLRLEELTGCRLPADFVWEHPSINDQLRVLTGPMSDVTEHDALIFRFNQDEDIGGDQAFAIGGLIGRVTSFRYFASEIASDWRVLGLSNHLYLETEAALRSIDELATRYMNAIMRLQKRGPYYIIGWSGGGVIAQEVSRRLEERGESVGLLLVDSRPREFLPLGWKLGKEIKDRIQLTRRLIAGVLAGKTSGSPLERAMLLNREAARGMTHAFSMKCASLPAVLIKASRKIETIHDYGWSNVVRIIDVVEVPGIHANLLDQETAPVVAAAAKSALRKLKTELAMSR